MSRVMNERSDSVLLYLAEHNGSTLNEITDGIEYEKRDVAIGIGILEYTGCVVLNWKRREDKRWEARYFIAGEGTRDYIEALKKHRGSTPKVIK